MSKAIYSKNEPFYLNGKRAMVSLGPFSDKQHCPYGCAFCYVQDDFSSYEKLSEDGIITFLKDRQDEYSIIYVSGDTDSFAPPRTKRGVALLLRIATELECDLLFTTRTTFQEDDYRILRLVADEQRRKNKEFYACISITRYSEESAYLEPTPIPTPDARIAVLKKLKELGATTVLAMRPFLPVVKMEDYMLILNKTEGFVDIALGENFYFIRDGKIQVRVFPNGISEEVNCELIHNQKMDFDNNTSSWEVWDSKKYQEAVRKRCDELGVVFSMHSDDAIAEFLHSKEGK